MEIGASVRAWISGRSFPHRLLVFGLVFANGLASAPRGVMLDDDGYFILEAYYNGVAHPPGYPLYTLLAHAATLVPMGPVAYRVHAMSALLAAAACAVLWTLARRFLHSTAMAYIPALAYAWSNVFWSQSIIAEVYSLNALLFFSLLLLCMDYGRGAPVRGADYRPFWIAFIYGLSLTNHWPLIGLATPALLLLLWPRRRRFLKHWPLLAAAFLLGLTPYLWMVVRSRLSEISFYGPITSWHDFWFYVSREGYRSVDRSVSAGWWDKGQFGLYVLKQTLQQFGPLGGALVLLGVVRQWGTWRRWESWGLVAGYLGGTFVLIGLLGFDYDLLHRNIFRVYPLLSYGICALWLGLGAQWVVGWLERVLRGRAEAVYVRWGAVVVLVGTTWLSNAVVNYRARDHWAEDYARTVLETLPRGADFFADGDYVVGPVGYLNRIEKVRPDVTVYSVRGELFRNRLYSAYDLHRRDVRNAVDAFLSRTESPVYYSLDLPHSSGAAFYGLYYRVLKGRSARVGEVVQVPQVQAFFERILGRRPPRELSELIHYRQLNALYCELLSTLREHAARGDDARKLARELERRCSGYYGLLERAAASLNTHHPHPDRIMRLLRKARLRTDQAVTVDARAMLEFQTGRAELALNHPALAQLYFARSISIWKDRENPAYRFIRHSARRLPTE